MKSNSSSRRSFIKKTAASSAFIATAGILPQFSAKSYARILGANDRINVSMMGVNSRGNALAQNFASQKNSEVIHLCDVDSRVVLKCLDSLKDRQDRKPKTYADFRKSLESRDVDAIVIAAPDHWHAPASLLAMEAGKHVYVEKPCSHNPNEGEILVQAAKKYGKVIQMGNQRRSWPNVVEGIKALKSGAIGRVYFGKGWYTNNRQSIGVGKEVGVPDWLDWELWQGPAPRMRYKDNIVHYNWHWLWHWGTGEALNNGTHMIDLLRWGMQVDYPIRVSSNGGRYRYQDDWETPDTQVINLDFAEGLSMSWEGRSCNGKPIEGNAVGVMFYGENGSMLIPGGNSYTIFDLEGKMVKEVKNTQEIDPRNKSNPAELLDALHIQNMFDAILNGASLNADIDSGHKSTLLVQLGNIAQRTGRSLNIDADNGHILQDSDAQKLWSRSYENGWEMKL
ncbi:MULTISPECIES: Gfo/Idh/MocA family protein [unclassified Arenibacter]|uniref:Gfo/Idh/MocA family protein n=1 Tax=unclassified Arenibacter TaxID=2615047 RepID=UPI000E3520AE|nr:MULTISPECIES: Gfo/Idh/MocA family oxidoreductase [unclassified Arenibacter]MCM4164150.1 dehydrogenase [Arenibacter sp. A80]RFT55951.1 gfo/Idh/MocA family oxidoreductase [Arenibacter sp. P308M17]